jgi:hypothetical protein
VNIAPLESFQSLSNAKCFLLVNHSEPLFHGLGEKSLNQ